MEYDSQMKLYYPGCIGKNEALFPWV
jgi:hypothetical protein